MVIFPRAGVNINLNALTSSIFLVSKHSRLGVDESRRSRSPKKVDNAERSWALNLIAIMRGVHRG